MSMNFNNSATPPVTPPPKKSNTKTIIYVIVMAVAVLAITGIAIHVATKMNDMAGVSSVSSNIISGEYDTILRQKCIEKLNSYGLPSGSITEGSINLCVDTAKAIAYHELNK